METNRPYISYSQYALFNSSPKAYYEKYVLEKESKGTKYQQFGKKLMEDLEFLEKIPKSLREVLKYGIVEFELTTQSKHIDKDLFGIIDVISDNKNHFIEIKSGKKPWTKSEVAKNEQMLFYALMINLKYKIIPRATLVYVETEDTEDGGIRYTGNIERFNRVFTLEELVDFGKKIQLTVKEIEAYQHSIVEVEVDRDAKLLELLAEKARIDSELDLLKAEIMLDIKEFDNKYAQSENFNITLASRKTYTYSLELRNMIKEQGEEIKILKNEQENDGSASYKITEYLLIKAKK